MSQLANFLPEYSFPGKRVDAEYIRRIADRGAAAKVEESSQKQIQSAYEKGKADAETESLALRAVEIEQLHSDFAEHLIVEKQRWTESEAAKISEEFQRTLERIQSELSGLLYQTIKPFLKQKIIATALAETKDILLGALKGRDKFRLQVCGPEDWVAAFAASLDGCDVELVKIEKPEHEVQLSCDKFAIKTQINNWLTKIEEIGLE